MSVFDGSLIGAPAKLRVLSGSWWLRFELQGAQPASATEWRDKATAGTDRTLTQLGRLDAARPAIRRALEIRPMTKFTRQRRKHLFKFISDSEYALEGARMAGLPE